MEEIPGRFFMENSKRATNKRSKNLSKEGVACIIPRIFNLAGRHINKIQSYAISNMLLQAKETGRIVIEANHPVVRSYCDVFDLMHLLGAPALNDHFGKSFHLFDVGGREIVELSELAERIAETFPTKVEVQNDLDFHTRPEDRYVADNHVFSQLCSGFGIKPANLETCIVNTKRSLRLSRIPVQQPSDEICCPK